jgi:hypothetical protein
VVLEDVDDRSVATVVRVASADAASGSSARSCFAAIGQAAGAVIERVGVSGRSITFVGPGQRTAHACDSSTAGSNGDPWCGHAFDRFESGRLRDPRLSLTCRATNGDPVGFAWIEPGAETTYVVVRQPGYAEVYASAGNAPVRVTTAEPDVALSHAAFWISEHGEDGRRLRSYALETQAAG